MDHLKAKIREIPDFPKKGILFYDITTLLCDAQGFRDTVDALAAPYMGEDIDQVIGIESRGFILGAAVANTLGCGFVPVRKPGKLPGATHKEAYSLEYGDNALEIHQDACANQQRILIVDDVLATGGTAKATDRSGAESRRKGHRHRVFDRAGFSERPLEIAGRAGLFCAAAI